MSLKFAILGLLNIKPMSGYDIKKNFDGPMSGFWSVSYGGLYPALDRLENKKLIDGEIDKKDPRNKKIYSITNKGKEDLNKWFLKETNITKCKDEYMLKLFLSKDLSYEELQNLIEEYINMKKEQLEEIKAIQSDKNNGKTSHAGIEFITRYSIETLEAEIKSLRKNKDQI